MSNIPEKTMTKKDNDREKDSDKDEETNEKEKTKTTYCGKKWVTPRPPISFRSFLPKRCQDEAYAGILCV